MNEYIEYEQAQKPMTRRKEEVIYVMMKIKQTKNNYTDERVLQYYNNDAFVTTF